MKNKPEISPRNLEKLVEEATGKIARRWNVPDCGLSSASRYSVLLEDDTKVFIKAANDQDTANWLRNEHLVLSAHTSHLMPKIIAWIDQSSMFPILISEDLSDAYWPASHKGVAWRKGDVDNLFAGIKAISEINASSMLPAQQKGTISIWSKIKANPSGFLRLNLCSGKWFDKCTQTLIEAESKVDITGDWLVHGDIRSDNICFKGHQSIFVDWSNASRGSKNYDLSMLLPTLYLEAGLRPFEIMPNGGGEASLACARHIKRIADKQMPDWLRKVFLKLIAIELEWAAQCLQLPKPDGVTWQKL